MNVACLLTKCESCNFFVACLPGFLPPTLSLLGKTQYSPSWQTPKYIRKYIRKIHTQNIHATNQLKIYLKLQFEEIFTICFSTPSNLSSQGGINDGVDGKNDVNGGITKSSSTTKSLKQREEEYAQARLRILGSTGTENGNDVSSSSSSSTNTTK